MISRDILTFHSDAFLHKQSANTQLANEKGFANEINNLLLMLRHNCYFFLNFQLDKR